MGRLCVNARHPGNPPQLSEGPLQPGRLPSAHGRRYTNEIPTVGIPRLGRVSCHHLSMSPGVPKPGDVLLVGRAASPQFSDTEPMILRVISVSDKPTYDGFAWITGYQLARQGTAIGKREIFVELAGLRRVRPRR